MIVILSLEANWLMCWKLELCLGQCNAPSIITYNLTNRLQEYVTIFYNYINKTAFYFEKNDPYFFTEQTLLNDPHKMNCSNSQELLKECFQCKCFLLKQSVESFEPRPKINCLVQCHYSQQPPDAEQCIVANNQTL